MSDNINESKTKDYHDYNYHSDYYRRNKDRLKLKRDTGKLLKNPEEARKVLLDKLNINYAESKSVLKREAVQRGESLDGVEKGV